MLKLNKCLVCDTLTHLEFIQESKSEDKQSETTTKKSVLENKHGFSDKASSHSSISPLSTNLDVNTYYYLSILVNSKLMILNVKFKISIFTLNRTILNIFSVSI